MTDEYCPADLSDMLTQRLQDAALDVFRALRLDVYARMDFIVDEFDRIWCLEANTLPGICLLYTSPHLGLHTKDLPLFPGILTAVNPKYVLLDGLAVV